MEATIRAATVGDAVLLAPKLRAADIAEIAAASRLEPEAALLRGIAVGPAEVAEDQDGPFMIFGVAPSPLPWIGHPWMLATPRLLTYRRRFLRESIAKVEELQQPYDVLTNLVDERNRLHIRWIDWCGFKFIRRIPVGPFQIPFLQFVRTKQSV